MFSFHYNTCENMLNLVKHKLYRTKYKKVLNTQHPYNIVQLHAELLGVAHEQQLMKLCKHRGARNKCQREKHNESTFFTTKPAEKTKPFHLLALAVNGLGYDNIIQRQESAGIQNRGSQMVK